MVINIWAQLAIMAVALIVGVALAPKPPIPKPALLDDFDVPVVEEGAAIPWIFGELIVKGYNVVWWGDLYSSKIKKKGGKK